MPKCYICSFILQLLKAFPRDLVSLKRAQILCFYMGRPDLSLNLVEQVTDSQKICYDHPIDYVVVVKTLTSDLFL